jgi:hypothetical protein
MKVDYAITLYLLRQNRQAIRTTCRAASYDQMACMLRCGLASLPRKEQNT